VSDPIGRSSDILMGTAMPTESGSMTPLLKAKPCRRVISISLANAPLDRRLPVSGEARGVLLTLARTWGGRNDRRGFEQRDAVPERVRAVALCRVRRHVRLGMVVRQIFAIERGLAGFGRQPVEGRLAQQGEGRVLRDQVGDAQELQAGPVAPLRGIPLDESRAAQQVEEAV
jgi:hypothetical protein